jgi:aerobic-type carbon monoxide dehydrogenase small subunit (CoxS/CutS family)
MAFTIKVNGNAHSVDVDGDTPLLWMLRDVLGGGTVHLDGSPVRSCATTFDSVGTLEKIRELAQIDMPATPVLAPHARTI